MKIFILLSLLGFTASEGVKSQHKIFHIVDREDWLRAKSKKVYSPASLKAEGFIHCAKKEQVLRVANRYFKGKSGLILLQISPERLSTKIVYDFAPEMNDWFPHIYAPMNTDAIEFEYEFLPNQNGEFHLPMDLELNLL